MKISKKQLLARFLIGLPFVLLFGYVYIAAPIGIYQDYGWGGAMGYLGLMLGVPALGAGFIWGTRNL